MNFKEAFVKLGIEKYGERIFNSNSHGELFHLYDYVELARMFDSIDESGGIDLFKEWFVVTVKYAEENWERPESVFQHIYSMFCSHIENQVQNNY